MRRYGQESVVWIVHFSLVLRGLGRSEALLDSPSAGVLLYLRGQVRINPWVKKLTQAGSQGGILHPRIFG